MDNTETKSDIKNSIFYLVLIALIILSITVTFYKIVMLKDYQITAQVSCDPKTEKCFINQCNPSTDDTCSENPAEQTTYYKNISKKAASIYLCENTIEKIGCDKELSCLSGEQSCFYSYCDPNNLVDGEQCSE